MSDEVEEFKKLMTNGDCPAELLKVYEGSKSEWRRTLIKQSMANYVWQKACEIKLKNLDKKSSAVIALLIAVLLAILGPLVKSYLGL